MEPEINETKVISPKIKKIASEICLSNPSPFYLIDLDAIALKLSYFRLVWQNYFNNFKIAYSYKTNPLKAIVQLIARAGDSAEVVSGAELEWAISDGFDRSNIYFDGPVKTEGELKLALVNNINIQIDSIDELLLILKLVDRYKVNPSLSFRLCTKYKGLIDSRFGMTMDEFNDGYSIIQKHKIPLKGLHLHVGSNINDPEVYISALQQYKNEIRLLLKNNNCPIDQKWIDIGGGFPAHSIGDKVILTEIKEFAAKIKDCFENIGVNVYSLPFTLVTEPGRCLTEDHGYLVTEIVTAKKRNEKEILTLNIGSNFIRSINNWYHPMELLELPVNNQLSGKSYDIYGANCFENDILKLNMQFPYLDYNIGKKVIIGSAGGYDIPSTNIWTRSLPPIFGIYKERIYQLRNHQEIDNMRQLQVSLQEIENFWDVKSHMIRTICKFPIKFNNEIHAEILKPKHSAKLFETINYNRKYLRKFLAWLDTCISIEDVEDFISESNKLFDLAQSLVAGIFSKDEIIGTVSIYDINWNQNEFCIGYWIAEAYQGKGIIRNLVSELLSLGFNILNLQNAIIYTHIENFKSQSIALNLGFKNIGIIKNRVFLYDKYVDQFKFLLTKSYDKYQDIKK